MTLHEARVGGHASTFGEQQHVARNDIFDRHLLLDAVASHGDALGEHVAKRLHRALGSDSLSKCEECVQDRDGDEHPSEHCHALAWLHAIGHEAQRGRHVEQKAEQVRELFDERSEPDPARWRGQRVWADFGEALRDLLWPKPFAPAAQERPDLIDLEIVNLTLRQSTLR